MQAKKNKAVLGILLVVFLSFVMLMIFASYTMKNLKGGDSTFSVGGLGKNASIAVVEVNGAIMDSKALVELIHKAYEDQQTKAIIIRINSPGGAVGPTQEIYEEIRRIDNEYTESEGKKGKPVYASFGSMAASGGYYLGVATRKIFCNAGAITGSIGVIMNFMEAKELLKWAKVNPYVIKAGRYKDFGNPNRSMTDVEKDMVSSMMEGVRQQFMNDILKTRKDKIKGDLNELAQGQIFSGEEAMKLGLVDELAGLWEAGRKIHEELKLEGEFGFKFIEKKKKVGLMTLMENLDESIAGVKEIFSLLKAQLNGSAVMIK